MLGRATGNRIRRALLLALGLGGAGQAHAMCMQGVASVQAFASDGRSVLVSNSQSGPEGGGSLSYTVYTTAGAAQSFLLSSDFSPGDGSRPQQVPLAQCEERAKRLAGLVKDFPGVQVVPQNCSGQRGAVVQVRPYQAAKGEALPTATLALRPHNGDWALQEHGKTVKVLPGRGWPEQALATLGPQQHILVISGGDTVQVWGRQDGDWASLRPLPPPPPTQ